MPPPQDGLSLMREEDGPLFTRALSLSATTPGFSSVPG